MRSPLRLAWKTSMAFFTLLAGASAGEIQSSGKPPVLLELFSSEGCSSCPPAEAWIGRLKNDPGLWRDVIPVVFHVDYWDGAAWADRFALPEYTARQRRYAGLWGNDSVYTPGFVADGKEWKGWFQHTPLPPPGKEDGGTLRVLPTEDRKRIDVQYIPPSGGVTSPRLHVAFLGFSLSSQVRGGENGGRRLNHDFVVLHLEELPLDSNGADALHATSLPTTSDHGDPVGAVAAWITSGDPGPLVQAAGGWLN